MPHSSDYPSAYSQLRISLALRSCSSQRLEHLPIRILTPGHRMQVQHCPDSMFLAEIHNTVEVLEPGGLEHARVHVILEVVVVKRDAETVESQWGEECGVGIVEEMCEELVEKVFIFFLTENGKHCFAVLVLVPGVARDEVFHTEMGC